MTLLSGWFAKVFPSYLAETWDVPAVPGHLIWQFFQFACHSGGSHLPGANSDIISDTYLSSCYTSHILLTTVLVRNGRCSPYWPGQRPIRYGLSFQVAYHGQIKPGGAWFGFELRGTQQQFLENICSKTIWDLEFSEHLLFNFLLACFS